VCGLIFNINWLCRFLGHHEIMTFFLMSLDLNIEESNDRST